LLDTKTTDANTLISLVREHQNKLQSVVGKGTVTFESPEMAGTAAFELALKKPDSLLVMFEGPFGIDLGTLFISREKYLMYSSMENKVVTGTPSAAAIRSIIPFDLTLDQVVGAFSGSFPFPSDPQLLQTYSVDDDRFLLMFRCGSNTCKYWVDSRTVLVTKYEMRDEHDELILDVVSSSFAEDGAASAPKRIRIRFPSQERQLSVSYSSISLNDPDPSFAYSIPSNARTVIR
jgi:outer membrane lipoprotein-sorting protein